MKSTNRRKFITQSCPLLVASVVGSAWLAGCSREELEKQTPVSGGYTVSESVLTIDLDYPDFEPLKSRGWINFLEQQALILKSNGVYSAYTNRCPHEGIATVGRIQQLKTPLCVMNMTIPIKPIVKRREMEAF